MSLLLHISDTHFGTERQQVAHALMTLAAQQQPDVVVLSGDITQRAREDQFCAASYFTKRLGVPVLAVPGNHDIPLFDIAARLLHPYARYQVALGDALEPVYQSHDMLVVCVNTTRRYRHVHGEVSPMQIERVAALLGNARAEQLRVVVVHQPIAVMDPQEAPNLLRGHRHAQQRWAAAGADLVLGGHIHLPYVMQVPDTPRPMWAVQAGTAISERVRPGVPNSVNIIQWGQAQELGQAPGCCRVEQWDFDEIRRIFVSAKVTVIEPARIQPARSAPSL